MLPASTCEDDPSSGKETTTNPLGPPPTHSAPVPGNSIQTESIRFPSSRAKASPKACKVADGRRSRLCCRPSQISNSIWALSGIWYSVRRSGDSPTAVELKGHASRPLVTRNDTAKRGFTQLCKKQECAQRRILRSFSTVWLNGYLGKASSQFRLQARQPAKSR